MPLTDEEANQEMRKMVAFIMQEAAEKAREIQVKADEEFNIEKAKLVRQETAAIEAQYERRLKQAQVRRKISQSAQINKTRLQVLQAREAVLEETLQRSRARLVEKTVASSASSSSSSFYGDLLVRLLLQAFLRLMETQGLQVQCRRQDLEAVEVALEEAKREFGRLTKISTPLAVSLDRTTHLPDDCLGGVIVSALRGRVRLVNTLDARLNDASAKLMPTIRTLVFGAPESRRFFD